jgi:hypothetical protein
VPSEVDEASFWARVEKRADGCWIWTGTVAPNGYGRVTLGGKPESAHRVAWTLVVGPVPAGRVLHHRCHVPLCVNPAHLEPLTQREHLVAEHPRSLAAINAAKTHCKRGHAFDAANTHVYRGARVCRACRAAYRRDERRK